jgi:actin-related protein
MDRLRLNYLENAHLVLDVGLTYTKCGFSKESMPLHVFQTPLSMVHALHNPHEQFIYTYQVAQHSSTSIRENLSKVKFDTFPSAFNFEDNRLNNEVEEFLSNLFYHQLKTNPKDKNIVLLERLGSMRKLT